MKYFSCCGPKTKYAILFFFGVVFIALPFALHNYIHQKIKDIIASKVKLAPGSQVYDQWKKPTIPAYLAFYMFSIVNPLEVMAGQPPFVHEKGPYSYRESKEKVNITWGRNKVNYNQVTFYKFDPETSCDNCDPEKDMVTSVNVPYVTLLQKLKSLVDSELLDKVVSVFLTYIKEDLFETRTVHNTIWGYNETLFEDYDKFRDDLGNIPFIGEALKKLLPYIQPVFFMQPNPFFNGNTTVNTGENDIDLLGRYERWKGNIGTLNYWYSSYANMFNGTDGTIYKPDISKDDILYIFLIELCRSVQVTYYKDVTIQSIDAYQFHLPAYLFESGDINPDNKAFCNPGCLPTGLLSVIPCTPFNAPIIISQPHFLNGNKSLQKMILGLYPNEENHDTFLSIEPYTGILLQASERIQYNIYVEPMDGISDLQNVMQAYIPLMWINKHVSIDSDNTNKLKKNFLNNLEIVKWIEIGLYTLGGLMVLIATVLFIRSCCRKKKGANWKLIPENMQPDYGSHGQIGYLNPTLINASD